MKTLRDAKVGQTVKVAKLTGEGAVKRRIMEIQDGRLVRDEALLMQYLLKNTTDKRERAYLINYFLEQFRTTLYRQTMFAEFELKANQMTERGEGLTADALCDIYRQLNADYFGSDIVVDEEISLEWARIPHFYYNYYVYQYSTGYAAAIALSQKILSGGPEAVEHYLGFLKGGCSKPPIDLLRGAGVDMATAKPIDDALALSPDRTSFHSVRQTEVTCIYGAILLQ